MSNGPPALQALPRLGLLLVYSSATEPRRRFRDSLSPMFDPVASSVSLPTQEEKIIRFWKERQIYEKTLAVRSGAPPFVFYEGPPTANGLPHPGHCLTRAIKDLFPPL